MPRTPWKRKRTISRWQLCLARRVYVHFTRRYSGLRTVLIWCCGLHKWGGVGKNLPWYLRIDVMLWWTSSMSYMYYAAIYLLWYLLHVLRYRSSILCIYYVTHLVKGALLQNIQPLLSVFHCCHNLYYHHIIISITITIITTTITITITITTTITITITTTITITIAIPNYYY